MSASVSLLHGRAAEVARLDAILGEVAQGRPMALEISGEAGIGKSRLLSELIDRAQTAGFAVLHGRAAEYEQDLPYGPWVDALDEAVGAMGGAEGPDEELLGDLSPLLPTARARGTASGADAADRRLVVHGALRGLLTALGRRGPLLVVLDDLHWADPASIDLLASLLRRLPAGPVLLALALRPRQADARLQAALARAERDRACERLALGPLAAADALALLDGVPDELRELLFLESGGNPFLLEQLARASEAGGLSPAGAAAAPGSVPPAVAAMLDDELRSLEADARALAQGAAVAGDPFEPAAAAAAAALDDERALSALDELLAGDLVRPTASPRRFALRHPLVRRAVYEAAGPGWRMGAHRRLAAWLEERGAAPEALVHHVALSAQPGDEAAIAKLTQAAGAARSGAPDAAAGWLGVALDLLGPDDRRRRDLLVAHGEALAACGRLAEGREALTAALALDDADPGAPERLRLVAACASVEHLLGRHDDAQSRLLAALDALPRRDTPEALGLLVELAAGGFHQRAGATTLRYAQEAATLADALGGQLPHAAAAQALIAFTHAFVGDPAPTAEPALAAAAAIVDGLDDEALAERLDAVFFLAFAEMYLERFEPLIAHAERGVAAARARGRNDLVPLLLLAHGFAASMLGRVGEARETLQAATEAARLMRNPYVVAWALMNASFAEIVAGDLAAARAVAQESRDLVPEFDHSFIVPYTSGMLATAMLDEGDGRGAAELLLAECGGPELDRIGGFWKAFWLGDLCRAELARGRRQEAAAAAARAADAAERLDLGLARAFALRARSAIALAEGDAHGAADLASAAERGARAAGARVEAARALTDAGAALARAGERERALEALAQAADELGACGATVYEAQAVGLARRLGDLGRRSAAAERGAPGLDALTAREREIAALVRDRLTNREIGAALFLSPKTIENHLRTIFAKLRIRSRVELARLVEQQGGAGDPV
ncbi:MAG TPA: AAA family ATPase [Capillimicrobium sp.]|jgi:DNA-binding CsgD family transcriptional regulator